MLTALVDNVLMPLIAALVGSPNFDAFLLFTINGVEIKLGVFITALVNFLLIAAAVYFALVMPMNKATEMLNRRRGITEEEEEAEPDPQLALLEQIRDEIKSLR